MSIFGRTPFRTTDSDDITVSISNFMIMNSFANKLNDAGFEACCDDPTIFLNRNKEIDFESKRIYIIYSLLKLLEWFLS